MSTDELDALLGGELSGRRVVDAVVAITTHYPAWRVLELNAVYATLLTPEERLVRVFKCPSEPNTLSELLTQSLSQNPPKGTDVVVLGGGEESSAAIREGVPPLLLHPFQVIHLKADGSLEVTPNKAKRRTPLLSLLGELGPASEPDVLALLLRFREHHDEHRAELSVRASFFRSLGGTRPVATYGLLVAIGLSFIYQVTHMPEGSDPQLEAQAMLSWGALSAAHLADGQWWRLISVGFLHADFMHVGANSFVLYVLGGQLERIIGTPRFLILYTVALICGSLCSAQMLGSASYSVGASGAIWGVLGAQAALGFGRPPILPQSIQKAVRSAAVQNLILNIGISFMGRIDWAAHFGGGLGGGLLLASGLLYRQAGPANSPGMPGTRAPLGEPGWLRAAAVFCVGLLALGVLLAHLKGVGF